MLLINAPNRIQTEDMTIVDALSLKQQAFVDAYLANDGNATLAYVTAGYKASTENVAASSASHLLGTPKVSQALTRARVQKLDTARRNETVTAEWGKRKLLDLFALNMSEDTLDPPEARRVIADLGKLCGWHPDPRPQAPGSTQTTNNYFGTPLEGYSIDQLEELKATITVSRALPAPDTASPESSRSTE